MTMKIWRAALCLVSSLCLLYSPTRGYVLATTVPAAGGCPEADSWAFSASNPLSRQWSTALPGSNVLLTSAVAGSTAQLSEIQSVISDSYGVWAGVTGTTLNSTSYPGVIAPITTTEVQNACLNDQESNPTGLNTICFDQSSDAFTTGVLAFTRMIVANAPGAAIGSGPAATFAGQILQADVLIRNDGQATFATPSALPTPAGQGAYDLESILIHELGHLFGLEDSGVMRAAMFPIAAEPGTFVGVRPTAQQPDGPLGDDDRTGIRVLYPDPADTVNIGEITGRVIPANPFALAAQPPTSEGQWVTGIFGAQVVAVDAATGAVIAGALGGWSCDPANPPAQFDGSFRIERLPIGHDYLIYAEPFDGAAPSSTIQTAADDVCAAGSNSVCKPPAVNTNFTTRIMPASP
jgi:hypothetical protein